MGVIILCLLLLIAALVLFKTGTKKVTLNGTEVKLRWLIGFVPLGLLILVLAFTCIKTVSPGKVAVPVAFGHTQGNMQSGLHIVAPWVDLKTFSTRQEQYTMVHNQAEGAQNGDDSVPVLGNDGATANIDATLLYHVASLDAAKLYKDIGTDFQDKIVRPTARTCIRDEFGGFPIIDAATAERDRVSTDIHRCIETNFSKHDLVLDDFQLRNVGLSQELTSAIDAKVAAQQAAQKTVFEIQQATGVARVTVTQAKAQADAQQILACGGTKEQIKDDTTGKLVDTVVPNDKEHCDQRQLTPQFLQLQYIQSLKGLVDSPNNSTVILPFDQNLTPLLNVGK